METWYRDGAKKVSYKSKKCIKQARENWVVVEGTHEPLVDKQTFQKVRLLVDSRNHIRSRTYQRFTKAGVCSSHAIKERTVTDAVLNKVREVCKAYLNPEQLQPVAQAAVEKQQQSSRGQAELREMQKKIDALTAKLDKTYLDRLNEVISEEDFRRFYQILKDQRTDLTARLNVLTEQLANPVDTELQARELVARFMESACTSR